MTRNRTRSNTPKPTPALYVDRPARDTSEVLAVIVGPASIDARAVHNVFAHPAFSRSAITRDKKSGCWHISIKHNGPGGTPQRKAGERLANAGYNVLVDGKPLPAITQDAA